MFLQVRAHLSLILVVLNHGLLFVCLFTLTCLFVCFRMCAVFGGTYCLRHSVHCLIVDTHTNRYVLHTHTHTPTGTMLGLEGFNQSKQGSLQHTGITVEKKKF